MRGVVHPHREVTWCRGEDCPALPTLSVLLWGPTVSVGCTVNIRVVPRCSQYLELDHVLGTHRTRHGLSGALLQGAGPSICPHLTWSSEVPHPDAQEPTAPHSTCIQVRGTGRGEDRQPAGPGPPEDHTGHLNRG